MFHIELFRNITKRKIIVTKSSQNIDFFFNDLIFKNQIGADDEIDLVNNMERPHMSAQRSNVSEDLNVHYVVPRPDDTKERNSEELSVYISTPNGLKKLERKSSQNSSSTE